MSRLNRGFTRSAGFVLQKKTAEFIRQSFVMRLTGVEPAHLEPESSALSTELQTHIP